MKIKSIHLQNFRCFNEASSLFEDDLTVFVAQNGQGKSTFLDAIKIALWPYISGFSLGNQTNLPTGIEVDDVFTIKNNDGYMNPVLPSSIYSEVEINGEIISDGRYRDSIDPRTKTKDTKGTSILKKKAKNLEKELFSGKINDDISLPVIAYYGTGRLWNIRKLIQGKEIKKNQARTFGYRGCLDPSSTFKYFNEWYSKIYKTYRDAQIIALEKGIDNGEEIKKRYTPIELIQNAINEILTKHTGWKDIRYDTQSESLTLSNDTHGTLHVSQLSDGIRNLFGVVADIAYRCFLTNPSLGKDAAKKSTGIILIDEVDMHLHPKWQQSILKDLCIAFPNLQFIVTTHSPQVISSVEPRNIRILDKSKVYLPETSTYGAESARILQEIFGTAIRPDNEVTDAIGNYFLLIHEGNYATKEALAIRAKLDVWLKDDPILDKADYLIARQERQKSREVNRA